MAELGSRSVLMLWGDKRLPEGFWAHVRMSTGTSCWLWTGPLNHKGYGKWGSRQAHRFLYQCLVGEVPVGMHLDHVRARGCTHRNCVNPGHLEVVTPRENTLRSELAPAAINAAKTHCCHGHEFTPENTRIQVSMRYPYGKRECRTCARINNRKRKLRLRQEREAS